MPPGFRFAVKVPREITHTRRLRDAGEPLERFLGEAGALGAALGPLLVQLPPSLAYDAEVVEGFFAVLRARFEGNVACEPRHRTWFTDAVDAHLSGLRVARVAADPAVVPQAAEPGGWPGMTYRRLHGSPRIYHSPYSKEALDDWARRLRTDTPKARERWCILDNTALGHASGDAMSLMGRL